jgi:hypothetical protein
MEDFTMKRVTFLATAYLLILAVGVHAEDIVNTLAGYSTSSAWAPTGPQCSWFGHPDLYGDVDMAGRFSNGETPHAVTMIQLPLDTYTYCPGHIADISIFTDKVRLDLAHIPDRELEHVRIDTLLIGTASICTAYFSGGTVLEPNSYYWVMVSAPGTEMVRWFNQNVSFGDGYSMAYRKDFSIWDLYIGHEAAMRVVGEPAPAAGDVEFVDMALFSAHWLESGCSPTNRWCGGADLDHSGVVNEMDLDVLASYWLTACPADWPLR